jgi:hypothetical protein
VNYSVVVCRSNVKVASEDTLLGLSEHCRPTEQQMEHYIPSEVISPDRESAGADAKKSVNSPRGNSTNHHRRHATS